MMQLLFCNTFSYDSQGSSGNWAVVRFPCMIVINEIRIIAPGVKVHPQLHDDQFLGKTSPNKFHVEFFSDDRSASVTTYDHVGSLEYMEGSSNKFRPSSALYSEKVLLNGWFNHITVAVYGGVLGDIGSSTSQDINVETPSLIIQEKPEGRSVYIRGVQDLPQLAKDLDKPEPLMSSFPTASKSYMEENIGRRDLAYQGDVGGMQDLHSSYYDRRHGRDKNFGVNIEANRPQHKSYLGDRNDYSAGHQRLTGRKTLLPNVDPEANAYRADGNERFPYKDKNRQFSGPSHQRSHGRYNANDNLDRPKSDSFAYPRSENSKKDFRMSQGYQADAKDSHHSVERHKEEIVGSEEEDKYRNQEWADGEYEEISDEETEEERLATLQDMEEMLDSDLLSANSVCFNPFLLEPVQLMHFAHPALTEFEVACNNLMALQEGAILANGNEEDVMRFESLVTKLKKIGKLNYTESSFPTLTLNADQGKEWVTVTEEIVPLITTALPLFGIISRDKYDEYLSLLIAWVFVGLNSSMASVQAIGINLRLLKCGINLAHKLCLTTQDIVMFLTESKLDDKLLSLLEMKSMASSVKIMIIHALDAYLSWPSSLSTYFHDESSSTNANYTKLLQLVLVPQAARVATALSRLMNKLALFHALWRLKNTVYTLVTEKIPAVGDELESDDEYLVEGDILEEEVLLDEEDEEMVVMSSTSNDEEEDAPRQIQSALAREKKELPQFESQESDSSHIPQTENQPPRPLDAVLNTGDANISETDVDDIVESVELIIHTLQHLTIAQLPKRAFPTISGLSDISDKNIKACLFRMLEFYQVLPSIQALLSVPVISAIPDVFEAAYKLLDMLMSRQDGLLYLASNSTLSNCIAKHLLCSGDGLSGQDVETRETAPHLGAKLAFHMQCVQCIDQLRMLPEFENAELEGSEEAVDILKVLNSLAYQTYGKYWISNVLSLEDNIIPLLAFIQRVKEEDIVVKEDPKMKEGEECDKESNKKKTVRKTATGGYAITTFLTVLKMSQNVSHLLEHRQAILDTMKTAPMGRYVEEVHEWLRPLEAIADDKGVVVQCMAFLKTTFAKLEWNTLMTSGPGLCTALRILYQLTGAGSPTSTTHNKLAAKTCRVALEVFSGGGLSVFMEGLEYLNKCFEYPCYSQHALTTVFSFNFHNLVTSLSENLLTLISHLLVILLSTEDGKFHPKNLLKLLISHYVGMYSILRESGLEKLDAITESIVSIFGIFSGKSDGIEGQESQEGGNVEMLLKELVDSTKDHCQSMVPGLILLSHVLPLPLPMFIVDGNVDDDDAKLILHQHQSWEQPLKAIMNDLCSLLTVACQSTCIPLLEVAIPLVQQIVDLSPSLAKIVTPAIVNSFVHRTGGKKLDGNENDAESKMEATQYQFKAHPIVVLAEIATLPSAKASLLDYLLQDRDMFDALWKSALEEKKGKASHLLNAAVRLASVLVDQENELVPTLSTNLGCLTESSLIQITRLACDGLTSPLLSTKLDSVICLRSLILSEQCFKEVKSVFLNHTSLLAETLATISQHPGDDASLSYFVLIHVCCFVKELTSPAGGRSSFLSKSELKKALKWSKDPISENHPLVTIKSKLEKMEETDGLLDLAQNEVSTLYGNLKTSCDINRTASDKVKKGELKNRGKAEPLSLEEQYKSRTLWVCGESDAALIARASILRGNMENSFAASDLPQQEDMIKVSLTEMAESLCPGLNLEKALKELTESAKTTDIDKIRMEAKAKRLKKLETFSTRHGKTLTFIKRSHGLTFAGSRGRGRGRGLSSGRQYDLFRQRKQNTSRPPSMHVDDFLAADEEDNNGGGGSEFTAPAPPTPPFISTRRMAPFKRDFIPRGRGGRGGGSMSRTLGVGRGNFSNFIGSGANTQPLPGIDKFRTRTIGSRPQDRFPRGRGRGREPTRSFSPRDSFNPKAAHAWAASPRQIGTNYNSPGGFRGGRGKMSLRGGRPLLGYNVGFNKWGGFSPHQRRGRGYGKPRGKHIRSFTR